MISIHDPESIASNYCCTQCKSHGVKLWRAYNVTLLAIKLICAKCICIQHSLQTAKFDSMGCVNNFNRYGMYDPAIPTAGLNWWQKLPTYK